MTPIAIFLVVFAVYVVNPDPFWSGDMNSNSVFALNVLEFRTIWLDAFAKSELFKVHGTYSFHFLPPGQFGGEHWTLGYPNGIAVITFPIYAVLWTYLKLAGPAVEITSAAFEPYRLAFSHIAAATVSAATVMLFFLISHRYFPLRAALVATGCLAFATMQWGLLSQSLLQHGPSSFVVMLSAYLVLRADDSAGRSQIAILCAAGAVAGMLFLVRPTNFVFMAALASFAVLWHRARAVPFIVAGLLILGLTIAWHSVVYQTWIGPSASQGHSYNFAAGTFVSGFAGLAISPVRGLIPNSPFLIFIAAGVGVTIAAIWRAIRHWDFQTVRPDVLLFGLLLGAGVLLYLNYAFSPFWQGGSYGTRYLSETMPILCYFLAFSPTVQGRAANRVAPVVFGILVAVGVFQQITAIVGGNKGQSYWAGLPYGDLDLPEDRRWAYMQEASFRSFGTRVWTIRDGQTERIWRGVFANRFLMSPTIAGEMNYAARCKATIVSVKDTNGHPLDGAHISGVDGARPYLDRLKEMFSAGRKFVHVRVRNDGEVPLFSYRDGLQWGFATMVHIVSDGTGKQVYENGTVHVTETISPGKTGDAIGSMEISMIRGLYRVEAQMAVNGLGYCGPSRMLGTVEVE